jgi:hypothetical protein
VRELCRRRWPSSAAIVLLLCCGARCARVSARDRLPGLAAGAGGDARGRGCRPPSVAGVGNRGAHGSLARAGRGAVASAASLQASAAARAWAAARCRRCLVRAAPAQLHAPARRRPAAAFDIVDGHGPAVVGWWRSRIVLPEDFRERYTRGERRLVLAHEIAHLRAATSTRRPSPPRCAACSGSTRCALAAAQFRFDQELACDAAVLDRFPRGRGRYGSAMLKTQLAGFGLPVGCHWQSSHPLKERIEMLKQPLPARDAQARRLDVRRD